MNDNKEKIFSSAVIYVHNAENRIERFLKTIICIMEENFEYSEIVCVNDYSTDGSLNVIKNIVQTVRNVSISVVNLSHFHGVELAMNAGVDIAIGDFVFEFDNTYLDYDTETIMNVYRRACQGFDIVSACPSKKIRFSSRIFYRIFNCLSDMPDKIATESFRILSRRAINRINSMNKTVPYRKALYANSGLKIDHVLYSTVSGIEEKLNREENKYRVELAIDSLILFTELGYKFSRGLTIIMMMMSAFMIAYSTIIYVTGHPVAGWTTTILFLSIAFLGLFGILTIMIKYLQILIDLIFKHKHYTYESIEKLTK